MNTRILRHKSFQFVIWVTLPLCQLFVGNTANPQAGTQVGSNAVATASVSSQLSGTWVGPFDTLANGESNRIFLKLQQSRSELKGSFMTLGYGMSLYGSIKDGKFTLYRPDRKPAFIQGEISGANLVFTLYGHPVTAHPETQADGGGPPKYIAPPALHSVPSNGLATTPPMGWNSWNKFASAIDDRTVRAIADALVSSGMRDAGYVYLNVDDTWEGVRDAQGVLQPNRKFPDMKALADYVHAKGLKLGIYSSPGPRTCGGYPGSYGHEELDAKTWAGWGIDYLKYDWCSAGQIYKRDEMQAVYQKMGDALAASSRSIVYSLCQYGEDHVQTWGPEVGGNLWRTTGDIRDEWTSMAENGFGQNDLAPYAGPGHWNDPDMLEVGNGAMSPDEYRTHMSLWSLLAAPLLAGNDVRSMTQETLEILLNREVIAIDQDKLGKQGTRLSSQGDIEIWTRALSDGATAVGVFNRGAAPAKIVLNEEQLKLNGPLAARDLWLNKAVSFENGGYSATIPQHGVLLLRIDLVK